jgi:hypothetical protein
MNATRYVPAFGASIEDAAGVGRRAHEHHRDRGRIGHEGNVDLPQRRSALLVPNPADDELTVRRWGNAHEREHGDDTRHLRWHDLLHRA